MAHVVAVVDEQRRARLRQQRVAVARSSSRFRSRCGVSGDPRLAQPALEVPRLPSRRSTSSCSRSPHERERRRRVVDRLAVRGQQQVGLAVGEEPHGEDRRRRALAPLYDHCVAASDHTLPGAVDEVAGEREACGRRGRGGTSPSRSCGRASAGRRPRRRRSAVVRYSATCPPPAPTRAARTGPGAGCSRCRAAGACHRSSTRSNSSRSTGGTQIADARRRPRAGAPAPGRGGGA